MINIKKNTWKKLNFQQKVEISNNFFVPLLF